MLKAKKETKESIYTPINSLDDISKIMGRWGVKDDEGMRKSVMENSNAGSSHSWYKSKKCRKGQEN